MILSAGARQGFNCWWPQFTRSDYNVYLPGAQRWVLGADNPEPDCEKWLDGEPAARRIESLEAVQGFQPAFDKHSVIGREADPFVDRANLDFRLKPGTSPVDAGIAIPHVDSGFDGKAPDAGALELGRAMTGPDGEFPQIPEWLLKEWPLPTRFSRP